MDTYFFALQGDGVVGLYEGNGVTQNVVCEISWNTDTLGDDCFVGYDFQHYKPCSNDETRSMRIYSAEAGTTIKVYDSPSGGTNDDYTIIKIKRDISHAVDLDTYEKDYEDDFIQVRYHHDNGLDGKVSYFSVEQFSC